VIVEEAH